MSSIVSPILPVIACLPDAALTVLYPLTAAGEWSCWSDWSACSVSCGSGQRYRSRVCQNKGSPSDVGAICDGDDISRQACEMPSCTSMDGWLDWWVFSPLSSSYSVLISGVRSRV